MKNNFLYYVEGETEVTLVKALKEKYIQSGKIIKKNLVSSVVSKLELRTITPNTIVVIVIDTDIDKVDIFDKNIMELKKSKHIKKIVTILQINKLEDELLYSTNIKDIIFFLPSRSKSDFKRDFCRCTNIGAKLESHGFDINKIWSREAGNKFSKYSNDSDYIKLKSD